MRLGRHVALVAAIAALLGAAVCALAPAAAAASVGWVRCANLSPGTPSVDIYLIPFGNPAHPIVLKHAEYGEVYSYMPVSAGQYTVASLGPAAGRRLEVLKDDMSAPGGKALVRVIQASLKQDMVTVIYGQNALAQQLAFGAVTGTCRFSLACRTCGSPRPARRPPCLSPWRSTRSTPSSCWTARPGW